MERIPISGPWITQREIDYVTDAVTNAWYGNANVWHERFEREFAKYIGVKHAIALPSCTSAIHLSLLALGVGPGDEVIVPDCTWIASSAPITHVGAATVFADIDAESWCLSPESFETCITPRTKAVIPVDLYGNMPDMAALREVALRHGIAVIEDAAEAIGAEFHGGKAGSFGDTGVFSFHGSKTLTTGEGGMLVTDRDDIKARALFLRDHGRPQGDRLFYNTEVAWKYKMSSMQAALGVAQLERVEELIERKREIFGWYQAALSDVPEIKLNHERANTKSVYWMVTTILPPEADFRKEHLMEVLGKEGIDCRPFFHPLSSLPAYEEHPDTKRARAQNKTSYAISPYGINLPSALNLNRERVDRVCDALRSIVCSTKNK